MDGLLVSALSSVKAGSLNMSAMISTIAVVVSSDYSAKSWASLTTTSFHIIAMIIKE